MRTAQLIHEFDLPVRYRAFPLHPDTPEGGLSLEQLFFLRPAPLWARHRTPIRNLEDYREAVASLEPGDVVGLDLYNPESGAEVPLTVAIPD